MIKESLTQLKALNIDGCVVIGDPEYYPRMGFKPASPLVYTGVEEKYFMKLVFKEQPTQSGEVKFHPIFDDGSH